MYRVFQCFLALFCAAIVSAATSVEWDLKSTLQYVEEYQKSKDAEMVYVANFCGGFIRGFAITAGRQPTVDEVNKVADIVEAFAAKKLIPRLKKDRLYEEWVSCQLDPGMLRLTEAMLKVNTRREIMREVTRQHDWLLSHYPTLTNALDNDPAYKGIVVELYADIQKLFAEEE